MTKTELKAIDLLRSKGYTVIPPEEKKVEVAILDCVPTFDEWWDLYDKKCGRKKTEQKWNTLSVEQRVACYNATPAYVASTSDKQYRKHPLTYLNGECWNDEIVNKLSNDERRKQSIVNKISAVLAD